MTKHVMIRYTHLIIAVWHTNCWAEMIKGSSSVFKEAVDGLFQHALTAQNHLSVYPWGDDALSCHVILNWQLQPCTTYCWIKKMKIPSDDFKDAVDGLLQPTFLQNCVRFFFNIFFLKEDVFLRCYAKAQEMVPPKIFLPVLRKDVR